MNEPVVPVQVTPLTVMVGVIVTVPLIAELVPLVAVNEAMVGPAPLAPRPIFVLLFVQGYVLPGAKPLNVTDVVGELLHIVWLETLFTAGVGFTAAIYDCGVPKQVTELFV